MLLVVHYEMESLFNFDIYIRKDEQLVVRIARCPLELLYMLLLLGNIEPRYRTPNARCVSKV